jgi:hypothetical protein
VSKKARLLCESFESCEIQALIEQWAHIRKVKS